MPHIHTESGQHDLTVSLYVVRREVGEWKCLVHAHKKFGMLMPPGGHVELNETVWQAAAHELREETGYEFADLKVLQPNMAMPHLEPGVLNPVPFACATFRIGEAHFHNDLCYGFVAESLPTVLPASNESSDVRWLALSELDYLQKEGKALNNNLALYTQLIALAIVWEAVPATVFSLEKPDCNEVVEQEYTQTMQSKPVK